MVNALDAIKNVHPADMTTAEIAAAVAYVEAMPLAVYALSFGGLIVSDAALATYKAEYAAKLAGLLAAKVAG